MKIRISVLFALVCLSMLALWGCPKSAEVTSAPEDQKEERAAAKAEQKPETG